MAVVIVTLAIIGTGFIETCDINWETVPCEPFEEYGELTVQCQDGNEICSTLWNNIITNLENSFK